MRKANARKKVKRAIVNHTKKKLAKVKKLAKKRRQGKWKMVVLHYVKIRIGISGSNFSLLHKNVGIITLGFLFIYYFCRNCLISVVSSAHFFAWDIRSLNRLLIFSPVVAELVAPVVDIPKYCWILL